MIKHAHKAIEFWLMLNKEVDMNPQNIIYLCAMSNGDSMSARSLALIMESTPRAVRNHLYQLHRCKYIVRLEPGIYMINGKGVAFIKKLFPFTYIRDETNASIQVQAREDNVSMLRPAKTKRDKSDVATNKGTTFPKPRKRRGSYMGRE